MELRGAAGGTLGRTHGAARLCSVTSVASARKSQRLGVLAPAATVSREHRRSRVTTDAGRGLGWLLTGTAPRWSLGLGRCGPLLAWLLSSSRARLQ